VGRQPMFLWWKDAAHERQSWLKDVFPWGTADETPSEEEQDVIDTLQETLDAPSISRPSEVSKAKHSAWAAMDHNRQVGDAMRAEGAALREQRMQINGDFIQAGYERTQRQRQQLEATADRVRKHREEQQSRGSLAKEEAGVANDRGERSRQSWAEHGARARNDVEEHRQKVVNTLTEGLRSRHELAERARSASFERASTFAAEKNQELEEKRERVRAIRAQTEPAVAQRSKDLFFSQRRDTADGVRTAVGDWRVEQGQNQQTTLAWAHAHRDAAHASRANARNERTQLLHQNGQVGSEMREDIDACRRRGQLGWLWLTATKRDAHDDNYESKFVSADEADQVVDSSFTRLQSTSNALLAPQDHAQDPNSPVGDAALGTSTRLSGKPNWKPFAGGSGWFSSIRW